MQTMRLGMTGKYVYKICDLLGIPRVEKYEGNLIKEVKSFQLRHLLDPDGLVGPKTWLELFKLNRGTDPSVTEFDYKWASEFLGVTPNILKTLVHVETGSKSSGFFEKGKPYILFEGHHMYRQLREHKGLRFADQQAELYPRIVYPNYSSRYYGSSRSEWAKFEQARKLDEKSAIASASWGMFQILGSNYKLCWCRTIEEFYKKMCSSQIAQFVLGLAFLRSMELDEPLGKKDWKRVARIYNGPQNAIIYEDKLRAAYDKIEKEERTPKPNKKKK